MIQVSPLSSISFDHDWKLDFQEQVDYYQKFKPGDAPRVQYADDVTSALKPFLDINGTVTELQPTTLATTDSIVVKEVVLNLTSVEECTMVEFYFAESQGGAKSLSTVFMVNPDLEGTVLVEYTHRRDEFDTVFNTASKFCFRVEGCFLPQERQFDSDTENFRDQRYKPKTLSAFPIEKKTLSMGGGYGVPYWVARLINKIFCLSNVYVDSERVVRSDGGVEITVLHNDYPLYIYKVELESSEDDDVNDILSLLRVVDSKKK